MICCRLKERAFFFFHVCSSNQPGWSGPNEPALVIVIDLLIRIFTIGLRWPRADLHRWIYGVACCLLFACAVALGNTMVMGFDSESVIMAGL